MNFVRVESFLLEFSLKFKNLAGELPLSIIKMKSEGVKVDLGDNKGFTLPGNIGDLTEITKLEFPRISLTGELRTG